MAGFVGKRIGVIGRADSGFHEALFLCNYTSDVTMLSLGCPLAISAEQREQAAAAGIVIIEQPVTRVAVEGGKIRSLSVREGSCPPFDAVFSALGSDARSDLVRELGTRLDDKGCVVTDEHKHSSTDGLFAAGDVVRSLDQISVAMGEAAIAATAIHNRLRGSDYNKVRGETLSFSAQNLSDRHPASGRSRLSERPPFRSR